MKNLLLNYLFVFSCIISFSKSIVAQEWISQATGFKNSFTRLKDIDIVDSNIVWAIGYQGNSNFELTIPEFTKSTNGGNTFIPGYLPLGYYWTAISAVSDSIAWVVGVDSIKESDGVIFKTINGGETWTELDSHTVFIDLYSYCNYIHFWNKNDGIVFGDPNNSGEFEIYTTINGGSTWNLVSGLNIPDPLVGEYGLENEYCILGNEIWFPTSSGRVFHSLDKGNTWSYSTLGIGSYINVLSLVGICFWNSNEGIIVYNNYADTKIEIYKTIDGGSSWNLLLNIFDEVWDDVAYVPGTLNTLIASGDYYIGSFYSENGGESWITIDQGINHVSLDFLNNKVGWSGSFNSDQYTGGAFKFKGSFTSSAKNISLSNEITYKLFSNPSDKEISIQLMDVKNMKINMSIYDLNGKQILTETATVVSKNFMKNMDISYLSNGIYMLEIGADEFFIKEKILILN